MLKKHICCMGALVILCCACGRFSTESTQLWFYTHNVSGNVESDSTLTPASFIYIGKGGVYTRDFGAFDYGHWQRKDNKLLLTGSNNTVTILPIQSEGLKDMQLQIGNQVANFEIQPGDFSTDQDNPYALENNQWRVHAMQKETAQQIKKRLQNHCRFWEVYFTWALNNELSSVDVRSIPTSIKIYGNGFALKPYKDLTEEWRACFYDSSDCQQANGMVKDIFEHRNIAWAHTDNKYKMFIAAFQQMERLLK